MGGQEYAGLPFGARVSEEVEPSGLFGGGVGVDVLPFHGVVVVLEVGFEEGSDVVLVARYGFNVD